MHLSALIIPLSLFASSISGLIDPPETQLLRRPLISPLTPPTSTVSELPPHRWNLTATKSSSRLNGSPATLASRRASEITATAVQASWELVSPTLAGQAGTVDFSWSVLYPALTYGNSRGLQMPLSFTEWWEDNTSVDRVKRRATAMIMMMQNLYARGSGCPGAAYPVLLEQQRTGKV